MGIANFFKKTVLKSLINDINSHIQEGINIYSEKEKLLKLEIIKNRTKLINFLDKKELHFIDSVLIDLNHFKEKEAQIIRLMNYALNEQKLYSSLLYLFDYIKSTENQILAIKKSLIKQLNCLNKNDYAGFNQEQKKEEELLKGISTNIAKHMKYCETEIYRNFPFKIISKDLSQKFKSHFLIIKPLKVMIIILTIGIFSLGFTNSLHIKMVKKAELSKYKYTIRYISGPLKGSIPMIKSTKEMTYPAFNSKSKATKEVAYLNDNFSEAICKVEDIL